MSEAKRLSRGYAPASYEELDAAISGDALQLLLRIRRDCDQRETDGVIATRHIDALVVAYGMSDAGLSELSKAKLVREKQDGHVDVNFLDWCRPAAKREERRAQWRTAQKRHRHSPMSTDDTPDDSHDDSTDESSTLEAEAAARAEEGAEKQATQEKQQLGPSAAFEDHMPTQAATILPAETWEELTGALPTHKQIDHLAWWLDTYNRLTTSQIDQTLRRVFARQSERQQPIATIDYFDPILRELNDRSKSSRSVELVRGEGEPPEPTTLSTADETDRSAELQALIREQAAHRAMA